MQLLGEEVHAEIAVLTSLAGGGDADNLARAALQDEQVANADVVAGDGDGVGRHGARTGRVPHRFVAGFSSWCFDVPLADDGLLTLDTFRALVTMLVAMFVALVVVMTGTVDGVEDVLGGSVQTVTEGVVVTVFVVISHITLVLPLWPVDSGPSLFYSYFSVTVGAREGVLMEVNGRLTVSSAAFELSGAGAAAVVAFGVVDSGPGVVSAGCVDGVEVAVVRLVTDVDLRVNVT